MKMNNMAWIRHAAVLLRTRQVLTRGRLQALLVHPCCCVTLQIQDNGLLNCARRSLFSSVRSYPRITSSGSSSVQYITRNYAKGKDKAKSEKGIEAHNTRAKCFQGQVFQGKRKIEINEELLAEVFRVDKMKFEMQKAVDAMKEQYVTQLSLRSSLGSIESLPVELDGKKYILQELGQVVRKSSTTIVINMAVFPQAIPAVMNALVTSGMNLNPQQDKNSIFVPVPKVTKEHRESLAKNAKAIFIKCRDAIKDVQNTYIKKVNNKEGISEDLLFDVKDQITAIADQYVGLAQNVMESKQAELIKKE